MNSPSNETMYSVYGNVGFTWTLTAFALALNAIAIPGIFMNFAVIWVTIRARSLHGTANYLLALYSLYELLHEHGHLLFLYTSLTGQNFLPYSLAVRICAVAIFGVNGIASSMAFTGLDRLFCVIFPRFPNLVNPKGYLGIVTAICIAFSLFQVFNYFNNNVNPEMMVTGMVGDVFGPGYAGQIYSNVSFALYNVTIGIYLIVGIVLRYRAVPSGQNGGGGDQMGRRIFRSLFAIIICDVGGYYVMRLYRMFIAPNLSPVSAWFGTMIFGIPLNLSAASNAPILYFTSKEYRSAFRREFRLLGKVLGMKLSPSTFATTVVPMGNIHHSQNLQNSTNFAGRRFLTVADATTFTIGNKLESAKCHPGMSR